MTEPMSRGFAKRLAIRALRVTSDLARGAFQRVGMKKGPSVKKDLFGGQGRI
jgi:hypothetical protein